MLNEITYLAAGDVKVICHCIHCCVQIHSPPEKEKQILKTLKIMSNTNDIKFAWKKKWFQLVEYIYLGVS